MKKTRTFEAEYNYFEPGTLVRPISPRGLPWGVYKVVRCAEPSYAGDVAMMFLEGEEFGHDTEYHKEVVSADPGPVPDWWPNTYPTKAAVEAAKL